jgi:spoIIIJ-associated protein
MLKEIEVTAKTVEEALENVKRELGVKEGEFEYQIEDPGSKGFLKIGTRNAVIKATIRFDFYVRKVKEFVERILAFSKYVPDTLEISVDSKDVKVFIHLNGEHLGRMIGKHGKTISALQHLATIYINRLTDTKTTVLIDVGDYKDRRKELIRKIARKKAFSVIQTGKSIQLDPMFAFERRIVHETIKSISGVQSFSKGLEPYRYVVIEPARKSRKKGNPIQKGGSIGYETNRTQAG